MMLALPLLAYPAWASAQSNSPAPNRPDWPMVISDGLGVQWQRPPNWGAERVDDHTVVLFGAPNGPDDGSTITLTNQALPLGQTDATAPATAEQQAQGTAILVSAYIDALGQRGPAYEILREAPFKWDSTLGPGADGLQVVSRLARSDGETMRQWMVAIPRTDHAIAHVWIYSAPDTRFEGGVTTARGVLDSLRIQ